MFWFWSVVLGAVIGVLARLIHPGKENMGWLMTLIIGIIGAVVGRAIGHALDWSWWISLLVSLGIAVILVAIYGRIKGNK